MSCHLCVPWPSATQAGQKTCPYLCYAKEEFICSAHLARLAAIVAGLMAALSGEVRLSKVGHDERAPALHLLLAVRHLHIDILLWTQRPSRGTQFALRPCD